MIVSMTIPHREKIINIIFLHLKSDLYYGEKESHSERGEETSTGTEISFDSSIFGGRKKSFIIG
jgi:hypothetical protein